jgi:hypothetical protein
VYCRSIRLAEKRGVRRDMLARIRATHAVGIPFWSRV